MTVKILHKVILTDGYYKGGLCYGEKNKVALMLVITLLFNIFYTSNVFATNLNINILSVLKINSMITDINSVVNLSANDEVELDIKYTNSNKNIQAGDEVTDEVLGISEIDECEEITKS